MAHLLLRRQGLRALCPLQGCNRTFATSVGLNQELPRPSGGAPAPPPPAGDRARANVGSADRADQRGNQAPSAGAANATANAASTFEGATLPTQLSESERKDNMMKDLQTLVANYSLEHRHAFTEMEKEEKEIDPDIYKLVRPLREGDVFAPHHLSFQAYKKEMASRRKTQADRRDVFDKLNVDPLDYYKNFKLLSNFVTTMGRIKHNNSTGLRPKNQRRIAKAIRRAVGIGLLPSTHAHPEMLKMMQDDDTRDYPAQRDQSGMKKDRFSDSAGAGGVASIFNNSMR